MNTQLQQLIKELNSEKEKAQHIVDKEPGDQFITAAHYQGKVEAFSLCIDKLTEIFPLADENNSLSQYHRKPIK